MTEEEYEKELVRMWDAFRTSHKGKQSYKVFEVVENWVKEHPKKEK